MHKVPVSDNTAPQKESDNALLDDILYSKQGCNLEKTSDHTRIAAISVNFYEQNWTHLKDIQRDLLKLNKQKLHTVKSFQEGATKQKPAGNHDEL